MDVTRYHAEAAARPDRKYSTLHSDFPVLRGGSAAGLPGMQPRADGTLYWQLDNPACTLNKSMLFRPEA